MSASEVYDSREEIGKVLVSNLRNYGNLEPPGSWGRAYNAGTKTGYCFSCANYLRMAAAAAENPHKDVRWYSMDKVNAEHYVIREGAQSVDLEFWHATDSGQGYDGNVRQFYNAEDLEGIDGEPEIKEGDRDDDREYAFDFLRTSGADMKAVVPTNESLFHAMYDHAQEKGLNNYGSKMAAHLLMKNCNLNYDYQNHPLFTDEELHRIESNPKILFFSMKQANTLMTEMEQKVWKKRHSREGREGEQLENHRFPFDELSVTYYYSSLPLKDFEGNPYEKGVTLEGEKAYEFLVQLNAADKEAYDRIQRGEDIRDLTEIHFRYGRYDHGVVPLRLGTLELRNKETVQEAVFGKLKAFRQELMANEDARRAFLQVQYEFMGMNEERFLEICEKRQQECARAENRWAWEEKKYLQEHPEIEAVNQKKANTYRYVCQGDAIDHNIVEFPRPFVFSVREFTEDMKFYADNLDYCEATLPGLRETVPIGKRNYLIESDRSPDQLLREGLGSQLEVAFTPEENRALANLQEFEVRIENRGNVEHPFDKPVVEEYFGSAAVEHFLREKKLDAELSREWSEPDSFRRGNQKEMTLSYRGEEFARVRYEQGSGNFVEQCPKGLPAHPKEQENRELQEAVYQQLRYQGARECSIQDLMRTPKVCHPDFELQDKLAEEEGRERKPPGKRAANDVLYAYYASAALRDLSNDTPEKFQKAMVESMRADGMGMQKIANVARTNPKFDGGLTTAKKTSAKAPARKTKSRASAVLVAGKRGREHGMEQERERAK